MPMHSPDIIKVEAETSILRCEFQPSETDVEVIGERVILSTSGSVQGSIARLSRIWRELRLDGMTACSIGGSKYEITEIKPR